MAWSRPTPSQIPRWGHGTTWRGGRVLFHSNDGCAEVSLRGNDGFDDLLFLRGIHIGGSMLCWPNGADFAPEFLYDSLTVKDG